eukprot:RCo046669
MGAHTSRRVDTFFCCGSAAVSPDMPARTAGLRLAPEIVKPKGTDTARCSAPVLAREASKQSPSNASDLPGTKHNISVTDPPPTSPSHSPSRKTRGTPAAEPSPAEIPSASYKAQAPEERQVSTPASLGSPPAPQPACPSVSFSSATRPASEASSAAPSSTAWESQGSMSFDSSSLHSPVSEPSPRGGMPFSRAGSERAPRIPATRTRVSPPRNSRRIFPAVAPGVPPPRSLPGRHGEATSAASAHLHSKPLRNPLRIAPMPPREGPPPSLPVERNTSLRFRVSSHPAERETSLRFRASHTRAQKARHRARQAPETVSAPVTPRPGEFSSL